MRVLFMGTPDFALFSLKALVASGHEVIGVVTQPDKPKGRGYVLTPPPVKQYAEACHLPVYQPNTLRDEAFSVLLSRLDPEVIVVVAYGKILPESVLNYPKYGCINVHGSLLPEYRGAAPMQRAILDGKKETGVVTMFMDAGLDTGDMLLRAVLPIEENDTFETVHDKLGMLGAQTLTETLKQLSLGTLQRIPQAAQEATYAAKIEKKDCLLDFSRSAAWVHDRIRGLSPTPLAYTHTPDGKLLKVVSAERAERLESTLERPAGEILSLDDGKITVACADGAVSLLTVLPEGKKKMSAADFIRGRKLCVGDRLG